MRMGGRGYENKEWNGIRSGRKGRGQKGNSREREGKRRVGEMGKRKREGMGAGGEKGSHAMTRRDRRAREDRAGTGTTESKKSPSGETQTLRVEGMLISALFISKQCIRW